MAVESFFIIVNSSGSDTAASGCGPATAVYGTGASITSGSTTIDLSVDSPDLSGVAADDLLWVDASSGRQFTRILSVDNVSKTVTTTSNNLYSVTESGKNWGIGGKRATLSGLDNFMTYRMTSSYTGDMGYYGITIEDNQTITSKFPSTDVSHQVDNIIKGSGFPRPIITCSQPAGDPAFRTGWSNGGRWFFSNLEFNHTNNSATDEFLSVYGSNGTFFAENCKFGSPGDLNVFSKDGYLQFELINCEVYCSSFSQYEIISSIVLRGTSIIGNKSSVFIATRANTTVESCVIANFTSCFSGYANMGTYYITNSIFDNIDNLFYDSGSNLNFYANHNNCYSNIGNMYNFASDVVTSNRLAFSRYDGPIKRLGNNYHNVTSLGFTLNDTETQIDPLYKDKANYDFSITNPSLLIGGKYPSYIGGNSVLTSVGPNTSTYNWSILHPLSAAGGV